MHIFELIDVDRIKVVGYIISVFITAETLSTIFRGKHLLSAFFDHPTIKYSYIVKKEGKIATSNKLSSSEWIVTIFIWAGRHRIIKQEDISKVDPVKIIGSDNLIIRNLKLIYQDKDAFNIALNCNKSKNHIISFDYLDRRQGAILELHCSSSRKPKIDIQGSIIDDGRIVEVDPSLPIRIWNSSLTLAMFRELIKTILSAIIAYVLIYFMLKIFGNSIDSITLKFMLLGGIATVFASSIVNRSPIPKSLLNQLHKYS